ncbi:SAM-dependent methyltransferase [Candidatus Woesearchaeota archaeon]|jgi:2-polyprenyl-3-methyl-5-hydroxy-6-metoxy-1,4-benzoquinol methylase|nr:SAM-dependent methyltransferase [Candidatus Woesearchaeota archaeon]MDP6647831.1 class I SAM-dependent methyltransferase [Candidatus Woesearchaeota archaeon]|tara:strand:- start:510 stop:1730 length:1221 start_codon:yes stop_codon:yes gene_type:complete
MKCRICKNEDLKKFLSLGTTPLANSFLSKEDLSKEEKKFPLELCFCKRCKLVQLTYIVPSEEMFSDYVYLSSTTKTFQKHFADMAEDITKDFGLNEKSVAVDIGSNDGILLKPFQKFNVKVVGVEPAANVAKIAEDNGIETINDFFNENVVSEIIKRKGKADVVTANNVFAHIDDIDSVIENVKKLLKDEGIYVIEIQYFVDTIEKMTFDNVYHEHMSYYTLTSLDYFFKKHGMEIFRVKRIDTHGGSLRVFAKRKESSREIDDSVKDLLDYEKKMGVDGFNLYEEYGRKVYDVRKRLVDYIRNIKREGKKIAAYGAPAKGNTLLNFCGIGKGEIDYIIEDNPLKQKLFAPGTHIPVVSSKMLNEKLPDYILILAWNFADEILSKTKNYAEKGVKFIIPLPEARII